MQVLAGRPSVDARRIGVVGHSYGGKWALFAAALGLLLGALLALAELRTVCGPDLLTAFVLGFEIECRVGLAVSPGHYPKGWHITSTCGVFGAAAGAAKLLEGVGKLPRVEASALRLCFPARRGRHRLSGAAGTGWLEAVRGLIESLSLAGGRPAAILPPEEENGAPHAVANRRKPC